MPDTRILEQVDEILDELAGIEGPLLPILHEVQAAFGHIPDDAQPRIAERLNISRAEVHGAISFYHDFRTAPAGRHIVKLCRAEACKARGADTLHASALKKFGVGWHETTPDGRVTLEPVYCLGLCATGPNALVDGKPVSRIDEARLDALVSEARQ